MWKLHLEDEQYHNIPGNICIRNITCNFTAKYGKFEISFFPLSRSPTTGPPTIAVSLDTYNPPSPKGRPPLLRQLLDATLLFTTVTHQRAQSGRSLIYGREGYYINTYFAFPALFKPWLWAGVLASSYLHMCCVCFEHDSKNQRNTQLRSHNSVFNSASR